MMDKSAIQQIQESANIPNVIESLSAVKTKVPTIITPGSFQLHDLEQYMETRSSYRLAFQTSSIKDYIEYGIDNSQAGAICSVDSDDMTSKTIFDVGTSEKPLHQFHTAKLQLNKTAAYKSILGVNGRRLSQKEASDFVEDWSDNLTVFSSAGDLITPKGAAAAFRDMTIERAKESNSKIGDYSAHMSEAEKIEAKTGHVEPSEFHFSCVPYLHLQERRFVLRTSIITSGRTPEIVLRLIKLEATQEEIAEEFKEILVDGLLESKTKVYMGSI